MYEGCSECGWLAEPYQLMHGLCSDCIRKNDMDNSSVEPNSMNYYLIRSGGQVITRLDKVNRSFYVKGSDLRLIRYLERHNLDLGNDCCVVNDKGLAAK